MEFPSGFIAQLVTVCTKFHLHKIPVISTAYVCNLDGDYGVYFEYFFPIACTRLLASRLFFYDGVDG